MAEKNIVKKNRQILKNPMMSLKIKYNIFVFSVAFLAIFVNKSFAAQREIEEKNFFASLRANETNVRAGPGQHYPIKFTFKTRMIPVRVINEYDNWSEIEDYEKQTGWVSQSLLTKKRSLLIRSNKDYVDMHAKNNERSRVLYHLKNNVSGEYLKCNEEWCALKVNDKKGWVKKTDVFGYD